MRCQTRQGRFLLISAAFIQFEDELIWTLKFPEIRAGRFFAIWLMFPAPLAECGHFIAVARELNRKQNEFFKTMA